MAFNPGGLRFWATPVPIVRSPAWIATGLCSQTRLLNWWAPHRWSVFLFWAGFSRSKVWWDGSAGHQAGYHSNVDVSRNATHQHFCNPLHLIVPSINLHPPSSVHDPHTTEHTNSSSNPEAPSMAVEARIAPVSGTVAASRSLHRCLYHGSMFLFAIVQQTSIANIHQMKLVMVQAHMCFLVPLGIPYRISSKVASFFSLPVR